MIETETTSAVVSRVQAGSATQADALPHGADNFGPRVSCVLPTVAWRVLEDGRLASHSPASCGFLKEVGRDSLVAELEPMDGVGALVLGVELHDGSRRFTGINERNREKCGNGTRITGEFCGPADRLLAEGSRVPELDVNTFRYRLPFDESVYEDWSAAGILKREVLDRVLTCPKCAAVATFRFACRQCGSGRLQHTLLAHHFACACVAPLSEFERDGQLACPNCRTKHLVAGTDFDYMPDDHECNSCGWTDRDLEQTGHCLNCDRRFPAHQAIEQELVGYDAQRLDVLALTANLG